MSIAIVAQQPIIFRTPFEVGMLDAQQNELCVPEMWYVRRADKVEYAHGHESVAGVSLSSSWFTDADFDRLDAMDEQPGYSESTQPYLW